MRTSRKRADGYWGRGEGGMVDEESRERKTGRDGGRCGEERCGGEGVRGRGEVEVGSCGRDGNV